MNDPEEIDDDELLYRKVSVSSGWYDNRTHELKPEAFKPRADDDNGISFDRAKSDLHPEFRTIEAAARGPSSKGYYVAVFRVGDLRAHEFSVIANPDEGNPGHALVAELKYGDRKEVES